MNKIIPILPCQSIREQVAFYEELGFRIVHTSNRPNPYAVVSLGDVEIHFYGSKRTLPHENPNMCYVQVEDVDQIYETFTSRYKQAHGKIPRSGIPRISKLKDLVDDRRFMITDKGGNTLFVGTPRAKLTVPAYFRTIESGKYAEHFTVLFDLLYSKEDCETAHRMLMKFFPEDLTSIEAVPMDQAKIWLVALDIYLQKDQMVHQQINDRLLQLFHDNDGHSPLSEWSKLRQKYLDIMNVE